MTLGILFKKQESVDTMSTEGTKRQDGAFCTGLSDTNTHLKEYLEELTSYSPSEIVIVIV